MERALDAFVRDAMKPLLVKCTRVHQIHKHKRTHIINTNTYEYSILEFIMLMLFFPFIYMLSFSMYGDPKPKRPEKGISGSSLGAKLSERVCVVWLHSRKSMQIECL